MIFYEVIRKGKRNKPWRRLIETDNRDRASKVYKREADKIRDGQIVLLADGIEAQRSYFAYFLRSRW